MVDFDKAKRIAIEALAEIVTVCPLNDSDRKVAGIIGFSAVFRILTQVFVDEDIARPITLLMAIPEDFPLVLPRFYISKVDREWLGYVPHVDVNGYVCLFDEASIITDIDRAGEIATTCFRRCVEIIEQGEKGTNKSDFTDEFVAYWTENYDEKDKTYSGLMMLGNIPDVVPCQIKLLSIEGSYSGYQYILFDDGNNFDRLQRYLRDSGYSTKETECLYLGATQSLYPPFNLTNVSTHEIVRGHFPKSLKEFERYIDRTSGNCVLAFSVPYEEDHLFFGLHIKGLQTQRKGFRDGTLTPIKVLDTFQKSERVVRLKFEPYTNKRLMKRTDGVVINKQYTITLAGLGSIGSNLVPNLMPLGIDTLNLIDPDFLTIANVNRHLLGPDDVGKAKVDGVRQFLLKKDPLVEIATHTESVVRYTRHKLELLNQSNYLFVAVGNNGVENFLMQALQEKKITIPTFFIWIEPYLIGGHCLCLHPGHSFDYQTLYQDHLFRYNVVDPAEYRKPGNEILLREAGCQGSYMPYGQKSITLFLASLIPSLFQIIDSKDVRNLALTWKSGANADINLSLSAYGKQVKEGKIHFNEL